MENFFAKLSLYDFLTTFLLGGCLYVPLIAFNVIPYYCDLCRCCEECIHFGCVFVVGICYLMGLICHKTGEALDWSKCINKKKLSNCPIIMAFRSLVCRNQLSIINRARKRVGISLSGKVDLMTEYLATYYSAMRDNKLGNIPKIEAHSALAKDLFFVFILVGFILFFSEWLVGVVFWGIALFLCIIRYNSELKIHFLVWEYRKYNISRNGVELASKIIIN